MFNLNSYISLGLMLVVVTGIRLYYKDQSEAKDSRVAITNTLDRFISVNEERVRTQAAQVDALRTEVRGVSDQLVRINTERYYRYEEREFRRALQLQFPDKDIPDLSTSPH